MSQDSLIKLQCKQCKRVNYNTTKNKKTIKEKINLQKHCLVCRKHTEHVEIKSK
ncbi:MAG: 50S ribosomal protein L33 [Minisyncoccia bacterium]